MASAGNLTVRLSRAMFIVSVAAKRQRPPGIEIAAKIRPSSAIMTIKLCSLR
jgi:hypothetical protein